MNANLSKDLRKKSNVRALPVSKDDEVTVVREALIREQKERFYLFIERDGQFSLKNQQEPRLPYLNEDRKQLFARKASAKVVTKGKGEKHTSKSTKKTD